MNVTPKTTLASHAAALEYLVLKRKVDTLIIPTRVLFTGGCLLTGHPQFKTQPRARKTWTSKFLEKTLALYEQRPQWLIVAKN